MSKVLGVGLNDMKGVWCCSKNTKSYDPYEHLVYQLWVNMLVRCYSGRYLTYQGCTVSSRWLRFSNFIKDLPLIKGYSDWLLDSSYMLDKDTLVPGNNVYGPGLVQFISKTESIQEMNIRYGGNFNKKCRVIQFEYDNVLYTVSSLKEVSSITGYSISYLGNMVRGRNKNKLNITYV